LDSDDDELSLDEASLEVAAAIRVQEVQGLGLNAAEAEEHLKLPPVGSSRVVFLTGSASGKQGSQACA
jgi:hypothetical protein